MILIDTNVISEPMKARADPRVAAWLDAQAADTLFVSAVSVSEILLGIEVLPTGRRRQWLADTFAGLIETLFRGRILPFDLAAARTYARVVSSARSRGIAIPVADGQIAATAAAHGFAVATRHEAPFRAAGVKIVDLWTEVS
jgi:toxin FitB